MFVYLSYLNINFVLLTVLRDKLGSVFLDLDNKTGQDPYGRWVAICYLSDNGMLGRNHNRMLVDSGNAVIEDFKNNEFDPQSWWS